MSNPLFEAWWNTVKDNGEFRGCTMPAAYAAWLAGKASCADQHTRLALEDIGATETSGTGANTQPVADSRKVEGKQGRYRGDKLKGAAEKIKQLENPDGKEK
jgi:hypothetical protein